MPVNHIPILFQNRQTAKLLTPTTYWPNSKIQPYFKTTQYSHVAEININSCCCVNIIPPEMLCVLNITAQWTSTISWDSLNILQSKLEEGLNLQSSWPYVTAFIFHTVFKLCTLLQIVERSLLETRLIVAVSCGYGTFFAISACDGLYHLTKVMDRVGTPFGFQPIMSTFVRVPSY